MAYGPVDTSPKLENSGSLNEGLWVGLWKNGDPSRGEGVIWRKGCSPRGVECRARLAVLIGPRGLAGGPADLSGTISLRWRSYPAYEWRVSNLGLPPETKADEGVWSIVSRL